MPGGHEGIVRVLRVVADWELANVLLNAGLAGVVLWLRHLSILPYSFMFYVYLFS